MAPRPLIFCGPSGVGKSTFLKRLMADYPGRFGFSVSHTTRGPRSGEENGREYHFTDEDTFERLVEAGEFLETAVYSGNRYGTSFRAVTDVLNINKWCILDIDVQGVKQVKNAPMLADSNFAPVYVFIKPPTLEDLETRLRRRNTDSEEAISRRLDVAATEIEYGEGAGNFDLVVVNDDLDRAYNELKTYLDPLLTENGHG